MPQPQTGTRANVYIVSSAGGENQQTTGRQRLSFPTTAGQKLGACPLGCFCCQGRRKCPSSEGVNHHPEVLHPGERVCSEDYPEHNNCSYTSRFQLFKPAPRRGPGATPEVARRATWPGCSKSVLTGCQDRIMGMTGIPEVQLTTSSLRAPA